MSLNAISAVARDSAPPVPTDGTAEAGGAWLNAIERSGSAAPGPLAPWAERAGQFGPAQSAPEAAGGTAAAQPAEACGCTVETRHYSVAGPAHHAFIVTTDADSQNYVRGGPANEGGSSSGSDSSNSSSSGSSGGNGPWGSIVTEYGPYVPGTIDYRSERLPFQTVETLPGNCDAIEAAMRGHADAIEAAEIRYAPLGENSNSVVREVLERSGLPTPNPPVWSPGWSRELA